MRFFFLLLVGHLLFAQDYFLPLKNFYGLSSTFGDMRSRHLHYGLDFRTRESINKPVYAVADGYVFRIFVGHYGYGKAIYIKHPDGKMSVYAHLDRFAPEIDQYVFQKQKEKRKFQQNLFLPKHKFPVKKGQIIGFSGNTGASSGPHLHFEIRNKNETLENPLKYLKISDPYAPRIVRIALQPLSSDARIEGKFQKIVVETNGSKENKEVFKVQGTFGVEFSAYDKMPSSKPYLGIYSAKLFLDDSLIFAYKMDTFAFRQAGYILAHYDYKYKIQNDKYLQKLYKNFSVNLLPIYLREKDGKIRLQDTAKHRIKILVSDFSGNIASYSFFVQKQPSYLPRPYFPKPLIVKPEFLYYYFNAGHLLLKMKYPADSVRLVFKDSTTLLLDNYYQEKIFYHYLFRLDGKRIPAFAVSFSPLGNDTLFFDFQEYAFPNQEKIFIPDKDTKIHIAKQSLLDTILFRFSRTEQGELRVHSIFEPVLKPYTLCEKVPDTKHYALMEHKPSGKDDYVDNHFYSNEYCCVKSKRFGKFSVFKDTEPPRITALNLHKYRKLFRYKDCLYFKISDKSEVAPYSVRAFADGKWVLCEFYDYQKIIRIPLRYLPENTRKITLYARDNLGNQVRKDFYLR